MTGAGYAAGSVRIWDGQRWRWGPDSWRVPTCEAIKNGSTTARTTTTTTIARTPSTVHHGDPVTVTATSTGGGNGNIVFSYRISGGDWVRFATRPAPAAGTPVAVLHYPNADQISYMAQYVGSGIYRSSSSAASGATTLQMLKPGYVVVPMSWWQAYNGSGTKLLGSGQDAAVHQGQYSEAQGNRKSMLGYAPGLPAGSIIDKVVFQATDAWAYWYADGQGVIVLGSHRSQTSPPNTWPISATQVDRTRQDAGVGSWSVDISQWACAEVARADFSGITIGPGPSTSHDFYGYSKNPLANGDFALQITYRYWG